MQCHVENLVNFFSVTSDQWAKVYIGVVTSVWADIHLVPSVFLVYFECCLSVFVILTNMWPVAGGEIKKMILPAHYALCKLHTCLQATKELCNLILP